MKIDFLRHLNIPGYLDGKATMIIRCALIFGMFLLVLPIQGITDVRQAQQVVFMLFIFSLFSLILKNIWLTLFLLWTIFLYSFFKFTTGEIYASNIFLASALYLITKVAFRRSHINFFINGFLWLVFANIVYMTVQVLDLDFMYTGQFDVQGIVTYINNTKPVGLMGHLAISSFLIAAAIPLLATRNSKMGWVGAFALFIPLYICKTSLCFGVGFVGLFFVLYFKIPKRIFIIGVLISALACCFYLAKVDFVGKSRFVQWHRVMSDVMIHPVTGWGLDSFRNITPQKDFRYAQQIVKYSQYTNPDDGKIYSNITHITWWDNPHNLYISILYEFGFVGMILFIGYLRMNVLKFKNSIKELNTIGLAGFILVFLAISVGHFPAFLGRTMIFIIPMFALFEVSTE